MMKLRMLVQAGTTNYITNPSMRFDKTGWISSGATVTRTLEAARFGVASIKIVTSGAGLYEGCHFRVSALGGVSEPITASAYVRGSGKVRIRLDDNAPGGTEYVSQVVMLSEDRWTRLEVTGRNSGGNDLRLYIETDEGKVVSRTFYVDAAQIERHAYVTTYCDGEQEACIWNGMTHASSSTRQERTHAGGRWVVLSGDERELEDLYMTVAGGLGMAPLTNKVQTYAQEAGGYHQGVKVGMRPITLTFHAKHKSLFRDAPVSLDRLHQLRQMLIDAIKPDKTGGDEGILFEYTDGEMPVYFRAWYDGGLEGEWDVRNSFVNSFPLRLLAVNPCFEEDSQEAQVIDFQDSFLANNVAGRVNGKWQNLNYGFNDRLWYPNGLYEGSRGEIYGAAFDDGLTVANNSPQAIDPFIPVRGVVRWDGEKWAGLGDPIDLTGGNIQCFATHPNGDLYVGGSFTSIGGVAADSLAYWDGAAWNSLGTAITGDVREMVFAPNGDLFVVGTFTQLPTGTDCHYIARWDGLSWHTVGPFAGLNDAIECIVISEDGGTLYVGGSFTDEYGNPGSNLTRVASYNILSNTFSAMGNGLDDTVYNLHLSKTGDVYAGGIFANSGSDSIDGIARWTGSSWESLGSSVIPGTSGANYGYVDLAYNISDIEDTKLVVGGVVKYVGGDDERNLAILWNGSTWIPMDAVPLGAGFSLAFPVIADDKDNIYAGIVGSQQINCSAINTVVNPGSMECPPRFYIKGPGQLRWIENQTTHKRMYFNLWINDNEEVIIDTENGTMTSNLRKNMLFGLLRGSDFKSFTLAPGENTLACFMFNDTDAEMSIQFTPRHWSADATGRGEEL
jgi:hypothetical protein